MHDTVEDTEYSLDQLKADFGDEIGMLVDGVTKLDKVKYGESAQAETVRKMIVAMSKDIRVLVIKLADRLHNARTWGFVSPESAQKKAQETLDIFTPLAHRLGIQTLKWELEDLSFAVLQPKLYMEIESLVKTRSPEREAFVDSVIDTVKDDLRKAKIKAEVGGRPKQYYSIYQKMVNRGRDFTDIHDLTGIRILVSSIRDCYGALGAVHARWNPMPGRFKDYIATPKFNLYQSLHTTVYGPEGRPVEIQIRTTDMHQRAEFGVAAHWKYKERMASSGKDVERASHDTDMAWLAHLSDWQAETTDPAEFLETLRYEIGAKELYVFTPQGKVIGLPKGATPGGLRLRRAHRDRSPNDGRQSEPTIGAPGYRTLQWRFRGDLHFQESGRRTESRLAQLCDIPAREKQNPPVVYQGTPRGSDRAGQRRYRQGYAETESTVAETDESGVCGGCRRAPELPRRGGPLRGRGGGSRLHSVGHRENRGHRPSG